MQNLALWSAYLVLWYQYFCGYSTNIFSLLYWSFGTRGPTNAYRRLRILVEIMERATRWV